MPVSEWLTYLLGSSRFWSFILSGMSCVAWGPEAYGWGSCPLNSDWMKCSSQLEIRNSNYQEVTDSEYTFQCGFKKGNLCLDVFEKHLYVKSQLRKRTKKDFKILRKRNILDTDLCGSRKLLGKRCHSLPTHTVTGLPSGTEWRVGSLAMRWNSGYRSRGAW